MTCTCSRDSDPEENPTSVHCQAVDSSHATGSWRCGGPCRDIRCNSAGRRGLAAGMGLGLGLCTAYLLWVFLDDSFGKWGNQVESGVPGQSGYDTAWGSLSEPEDASRDCNYVTVVVTLRQPLYIGVLTLGGHRESRARACNDTWGPSPYISTVEYFTATNAREDYSMDTSGGRPGTDGVVFLPRKYYTLL